MKRIQSLHLRNFKAFADQVFDFTSGEPNDQVGRHVLIYGNNGSGKSSVFWALYTFLQSAGKTRTADITKYFVPLREDAEETYQSLRHVFAPAKEEAFIEVTWADMPPTTRTTQRLGLEVAADNPATGQPYSELERTRNDPARGTDQTIREANLGSDFIHYRFLQDFYQRSNREQVNLWPVFMRDLFPFYPTPLVEDEAGVPQRLEVVLQQLLKEGRSRERWHETPRYEFEARIKRANEAIAQFVYSVKTNANAFLRDHFLDGKQTLQIELEYNGQLYFDLLRHAPATAVEYEWRQEVGGELVIALSVVTKRQDRPEVRHYRPQSFLNEAQLTRIALAVRLGALLTRAAASELKLLCLDDLLISLDMGNRKHVLDWLFGQNGKYCNEFQIICLTHDRELYRMLKHYISRPQSGKWRVWELVNNEYYPTDQPSLLNGDSNDHYTQAWRRFHAQDYPACANYLRKETERLLKIILPAADRYQPPGNDGEPVPMPMGTQLDKLQQLFTKLGKGEGMGPLEELALFKQLLLNPLSHDSFSTTVYQSELHRMLEHVIPAMQKMKRKEVQLLEPKGVTHVYLNDSDSNGIRYDYTIELHENLWEYTFPDESVAYSHPACRVTERLTMPNGPIEHYDEHQGKCKDLADAYRKIRHNLDGKGNPMPRKPLRDIVSIF